MSFIEHSFFTSSIFIPPLFINAISWLSHICEIFTIPLYGIYFYKTKGNITRIVNTSAVIFPVLLPESFILYQTIKYLLLRCLLKVSPEFHQITLLCLKVSIKSRLHFILLLRLPKGISHYCHMVLIYLYLYCT